MRFDKPIDKVDSIVGIPIFFTKNENKNIHNTDQKQEYIASNDVTEQKVKKSITGLKQLKL